MHKIINNPSFELLVKISSGSQEALLQLQRNLEVTSARASQHSNQFKASTSKTSLKTYKHPHFDLLVEISTGSKDGLTKLQQNLEKTSTAVSRAPYQRRKPFITS